MFATSTQRKFWIFADETDINRLKNEAIAAYIEQRQKSAEALRAVNYFLTLDQQNLLVRHYERMLEGFCKQFDPPMPPSVMATAMIYLKRIYIKHTVMDYHPRDIVTACVYLAAKVDEFNVSLRKFVNNLKKDREKVAEQILWFELPLMSMLGFHLTVHTAYRPLEGLFINLKTHVSDVDVDSLRPACDKYLETALYTNAYLIAAPSQIALAALLHAAKPKNLNLKYFITDCVMRGSTQAQIESLFNKIRQVTELVSAVTKPSKTEIKSIEKKLDVCRNQLLNPNNELFKARMRQLDDNDDEQVLEMYRNNSQEQVDMEEELLTKS